MSEKHERQQLVAWSRRLAAFVPELRLLFAIPNEGPGRRNAGYRASLARQGMQSGVPDLFLPVASGEYHGLFIEMKASRGGRVDAEQLLWQERLTEQGYHAVIARGWEQARDAILWYLELFPCGHRRASRPYCEQCSRLTFHDRKE